MAKRKTNKALLLVFIGVVLISLIAVTYAFFSGGVTTTNEQTVASEAGTMRLIMNDGNTSGHKVEPKIEREVVPIKIITERTERFFFVAIKRKR